MAQPSEPSVEEILASIKRVIARDNRAETGPLRASELPQETSEPEDDVLELAEDSAVAPDSLSAEAPLVTEDAIQSMRESLAALSVMSEPRAAPQIVRSGETSLEDLTRELLRPALAEWLDKNLPPLVERMVAAEISRIVGKKA
jgi:cell pole-organizing protein PopZ